MSGFPPPWFDPDLDPVRRLRATLPVTVRPDGTLVLPDAILWAFALNAGELLAVRPEEGSSTRFSFTSYGRRAWSASAICGAPWPSVEALLRQPLAAVGPGGSLEMPAEAADLIRQPGETLILKSYEYEHEPAFTLGRPVEGLPERQLILEASYSLPVETGPQVRLPPEVLWILSLSEGDLLDCEAQWLEAELRRADPSLPGRKAESSTRVGEGGTVPVPDRVIATAPLKPPERLTLSVFLAERGGVIRLDAVLEG